MTERTEIRKERIRTERLRWQKVETLAKAIRRGTYRVRTDSIAEALLRETLMLNQARKNEEQ